MILYHGTSHDGENSEEEGMEAIAQTAVINKPERKKRAQVSTAELFTALEGLLPAAQIEIELRADFVENFPHDEDHVEDVRFVRQGLEAIELANRLIARRTGNTRRKQRASVERQGQADG